MLASLIAGTLAAAGFILTLVIRAKRIGEAPEPMEFSEPTEPSKEGTRQ